MIHLEIEPATAKRVGEHRLDQYFDDSMWVAEEKLDGWRELIHFGGGLDRLYLTGRRTSSETGKFSEKGHLVQMLSPNKLSVDLGYTILDGEVIPPVGAGFRDLSSILNSSPEESARSVLKLGPPRFVAFDVLFYDGVDMRENPLIERQNFLREAINRYGNPLVNAIQGVKDSRAHYESIVEAGGEGVILKDLTSAYAEPGSWIKVKRYSTLDVIVTGFTEGKGKYVGQIGAAIVSVLSSSGQTLDVGQVSGMTDEVRLDMTQSPGDWIGRVIEIAAQEFAKERLRHPRFKRVRQDSDPTSCTFEKMMRDLGQSVAFVPREQIEMFK